MSDCRVRSSQMGRLILMDFLLTAILRKIGSAVFQILNFGVTMPLIVLCRKLKVGYYLVEILLYFKIFSKLSTDFGLALFDP